MDEVDQELFLEMLLKLDGTHESIKAASKWCRANAQYHQDVSRMWFFAVAKARTMTRRLDLFHFASDILFTAEPQSMSYFSSFLPQLVKAVSLVRGEEIKLSMKKLFALWREKNIYNKPVMDQLSKMLRNRNKVVDMNVFRYDRELLFKNLLRIQDLKPACDYLIKGMENSPSFDDTPKMMKERRACNSLLSVVDDHKTKVTSLVSYLEEMVHLLKMATNALDIAANREQNGMEETKLKIVAYGRYHEKVLSLLHRLESNYHISKKDLIVPVTPASPDPEETTLFSRRADVSSSDSPASPHISVSTVSTWKPQLPSFSSGAATEPEIFHRREPYRTPFKTNLGPRTPTTDPYPTNLGSRTPTRDPYPTNLGSRTPTRDPYPTNLGSRTPTRDPYPTNLGSRTPTRDPYPTNLGSRTPTRDPYPTNLGSRTPNRDPYPTNLGSRTPTRDPYPTNLGSRTPSRDPYPTNLGSRTPSRDPYPTNLGSRTPTRDPYPVTLRDAYPSNAGSMTPTRDPYPSNAGSMTPTRDPYPRDAGSLTPTREAFAYPTSPSYAGSSSWGGAAQSFNSGGGPVYQKWYTGINQTTDCSSPRPTHISIPSNPLIPSLMSIPFTTFMGPSFSGFQNKQ